VADKTGAGAGRPGTLSYFSRDGRAFRVGESLMATTSETGRRASIMARNTMRPMAGPEPVDVPTFTAIACAVSGQRTGGIEDRGSFDCPRRTPSWVYAITLAKG